MLIDFQLRENQKDTYVKDILRRCIGMRWKQGNFAQPIWAIQHMYARSPKFWELKTKKFSNKYETWYDLSIAQMLK